MPHQNTPAPGAGEVASPEQLQALLQRAAGDLELRRRLLSIDSPEIRFVESHADVAVVLPPARACDELDEQALEAVAYDFVKHAVEHGSEMKQAFSEGFNGT